MVISFNFQKSEPEMEQSEGVPNDVVENRLVKFKCSWFEHKRDLTFRRGDG